MTRVICLFGLLTAFSPMLSNGSALYAGEPPCAVCDAGVTMLSKIPYLNRLFKNVGVDRDCQECVTEISAVEELPRPGAVRAVPIAGQPRCFRQVGADGLERIGIDFEFDGPCAAGECTAAQCSAGQCSAGKCATGKCIVGHCSAGKCATGECATGRCPGDQCASEECTCSAETCAAGRCAPAFALFAPPLAGPGPLLMQIDSLGQQNRELLEALVESRVENATLAAKLEFADEREKLVVENALLKAQSASPVAVATHDTEAALLREENAALKAKLLAMEERLASLEQPSKKTSDKATAKRKR